jgi:hypothetical protein
LRECKALPDSQAGSFEICELRSLPGRCEQENDPARQRQPTEYRRDRNAFLLVRSSVDRPKIDNFFTVGVRESLIREGQCAQDDQDEG